MRSIVVLCVLAVASAGCSQMDRMTRPRDAAYPYPDGQQTQYSEMLAADLTLEVRCIQSGRSQREAGANAQDGCAYKSVNEAKTADGAKVSALSKYFHACGQPGTRADAECIATRNRVVDLLLKVTDENCSTFLQRTFLTKSTSDSAYAFGRDMLTGGTAAVASASPPTAIGFSFANLLLGSYETVNGTFFLNSAFQSLETAINLERETRLTALRDECTRPGTTTAGYNDCTIHEALRLVKSYGDACSLRTGVNKLQSLVHLQQTNQENVNVKADLEKTKKELAANKADLQAQQEAMKTLPVEAISRRVREELLADFNELRERLPKQTTTTPPDPKPSTTPTVPPDSQR
ncbi:hypothetical protein [Agrilutibacter solisilvae]|uniref:Uncharacterized protein n=1 Tax=Agrilutibacter solisilvae TaxID=2763317 RepID=A0A974Y1S8_9GAMM|nr:hypothetical protein [Lysobacter solisilvae]QSX78963.1 hypothetical protein I8J32_003285 [Lysobacter solisilvae]